MHGPLNVKFKTNTHHDILPLESVYNGCPQCPHRLSILSGSAGYVERIS